MVNPAKKDWNRPFEDPIVLPDARALLTLKNAADYIISECEHAIIALDGPPPG